MQTNQTGVDAKYVDPRRSIHHPLGKRYLGVFTAGTWNARAVCRMRRYSDNMIGGPAIASFSGLVILCNLRGVKANGLTIRLPDPTYEHTDERSPCMSPTRIPLERVGR